MSDYLSDTRKTSYFKWGLFWDVDIGRNSLAFDFENFKQISDRESGEVDQSRFELSVELNIPIWKNVQLTVGYEEEFYNSEEIPNILFMYVSAGIKRPLALTF
jgi:hypothetical protein